MSLRSPSPAVTPQTTQSRVAFFLIFTQSLLRAPGRYRLALRFAMMPSRPRAKTTL